MYLQNEQLTEEQLAAIAAGTDVTDRIVCITGGAGVGKTTIMQRIYAELTEHYDNIYGKAPEEIPHVVLCAPTGRAANRIQEATGIRAETIHRLLRFSTPKEDTDVTLPMYTRLNPLPYRAVLVDEASMITDDLWRGLMDAMRRTGVVRFFGDINQLPPVYTDGRHVFPFADGLRKHTAVYLTHNFRSGEEIVQMADRIIRGRMPTTNSSVTIRRLNPTMVSSYLTKLCDEKDFTSPDRQIICPTNSTKWGTDNINNLIQARYNPARDKLQIIKADPYVEGGMTVTGFKRKDKVLWRKNDYALGLMNGTTGILLDYDTNGDILCLFDGEEKLIPHTLEGFNPSTGEKYFYDPRQLLGLGYAISTHKAQGSQYRDVIYVISHSRAATRQNVYTAFTRAQESVYVFDIRGALSRAIDTQLQL